MRICPKCNRRFPDNTLFCPDDGKALVERVGAQSSSNTGAANTGAQPDQFAATQAMEQVKVDNQPTGGRTPNRKPSPTPTRREAPPSMTASRTGGLAPNTGGSPAPQTGGPPSAASIDTGDLVGESIFGEYTITSKLGEGGMGAVYLASQNSIDQKIAVKVLHQESAESDELVQRFHREARVVAMLTHPNIIRVFIFGRTQGGLLYLAMEFVEGETLRDLLDRGILDEMRVIKIMKQLCSGLSEAHDLGIIHRDLKPDNVLMTEWRGEKDFAKILDFGIAKLKQPDGSKEQQKLTQAGIVYGTPEYLSPEQAQAIDLDHRTDIYSLGCMLYELMTGRVPFEETTPVKILTAHVFNEVEPPSKVAPDRVSPTMEKIILKAMAKEPGDRFQDALSMFEALVAREQEIVREKGLSGRAGYVPGMELTGMYRAVDFDDEFNVGGSTPNAPAPTYDTAATARPSQPSATSAQPSAPKSKDSTRTVIYLLLAGTGMLFFVLLITIVILVMQ